MTGRLNPSRETKFSGTHGDRGIFIFPVQLITSRIGNLTRLIHTLLYAMTIHIYILHPKTLYNREPSSKSKYVFVTVCSWESKKTDAEV